MPDRSRCRSRCTTRSSSGRGCGRRQRPHLSHRPGTGRSPPIPTIVASPPNSGSSLAESSPMSILLFISDYRYCGSMRCSIRGQRSDQIDRCSACQGLPFFVVRSRARSTTIMAGVARGWAEIISPAVRPVRYVRHLQFAAWAARHFALLVP